MQCIFKELTLVVVSKVSFSKILFKKDINVETLLKLNWLVRIKTPVVGHSQAGR